MSMKVRMVDTGRVVVIENDEYAIRLLEQQKAGSNKELKSAMEVKVDPELREARESLMGMIDESREETFQWRYGLEIVFPSSNRTRKKNSHLWAGVYYEHQWDSTTTDGTNNTTHTGKWIFCFGT